MLERKPEEILKKAILGMISRNNLRHKYIEPRLKIYSGPSHPHAGQLPADVTPLNKHPRRREGGFNHGFDGGKYVAENSYQGGGVKN